MSGYLNEINWDEILSGANVQEQYKIFIKEYRYVCSKLVKEIRVKEDRKERPPWLSKELRRLIRRKANLWRRYTTSGKMGSLEDYKKYGKKGVKKAAKAYELVIISKAKNDPKLLYAYINNRQQTKESIRSIRAENGYNVTDRKKIASILNRQFKSVFIVDEGEEMPEFKLRTNKTLMEEEEKMFELIGIDKRLENLDGTKAMGRDKVSAMVLKSCSGEWAKALQIIFKKSFKYSKVPEEWGMANITPLFKNRS